MEKGVVQVPHSISRGDAAVSGMFGGLLAGVAMGAVIAFGSLLAGQGFAYLGDFSTGSAVSPGQGFLMHLGVSAIYGMLYALLRYALGERRLARVPGWLAGLVYALLLWAFAVTVLLPASNALILRVPWPVFFAGHIAYGLVLGASKRHEARDAG